MIEIQYILERNEWNVKISFEMRISRQAILYDSRIIVSELQWVVIGLIIFKKYIYSTYTLYLPYKYVSIYIYVSIMTISMIITHLYGCLIFHFPGLKRSWGSFSSCNPCRWMLRSSKCWRIQDNILGGLESFLQQKKESNSGVCHNPLKQP